MDVFDDLSQLCDMINRSDESRKHAMKLLEMQEEISNLPISLVEPSRKFKGKDICSNLVYVVIIVGLQLSVLLFVYAPDCL